MTKPLYLLTFIIFSWCFVDETHTERFNDNKYHFHTRVSNKLMDDDNWTLDRDFGYWTLTVNPSNRGYYYYCPITSTTERVKYDWSWGTNSVYINCQIDDE